MYTKILYLLKAAFILKLIQQSTIQINYKPNKKNKIQFLRKDNLSKVGILTKPMKNLVIIASSLWARYLLKNFLWEANIHSDIMSLSPVCICSHFDGAPSLISANLIIKCPLKWNVRISKNFYSILININKYEVAHTSPVVTRAKELS